MMIYIGPDYGGPVASLAWIDPEPDLLQAVWSFC